MRFDEMSRVLVEIEEEPLRMERYTSFVSEPSAGAIATFTGVTRDSFEGRGVTKLEYEAYPEMATSLMEVGHGGQTTRNVILGRLESLWNDAEEMGHL